MADRRPSSFADHQLAKMCKHKVRSIASRLVSNRADFFSHTARRRGQFRLQAVVNELRTRFPLSHSSLLHCFLALFSCSLLFHSKTLSLPMMYYFVLSTVCSVREVCARALFS